MAEGQYTAKWPGKCYVCSEPYPKGASITWRRTGRIPGVSNYRHVGCQDNGAPDGAGATPEATPETQPTLPGVESPSEVFGVLEALGAIIAERPTAATVDEETVRRIVREALAKHRRDVTVTVKRPDAPDVKVAGAHSQMSDLLDWLAAGDHVHLWGAPGAGKSHAVRQAAEALGRPFYVESLAPTDTRSLLIGFRTPTGDYVRTRFRDAVEFGGVLALEEVDNTSSALLVTLNVLLANGHITFPDAEVKVHPDFVCVILSNTAGRGGDVLYPERRPIDVAFLSRFVPIAWQYDADLERRLALSYNPEADAWVDYVQALRKWAADNRKRLIVTPRQTIRIAQALARGRKVSDVLSTVIFGNVDADLAREARAAVEAPRA